MASTAARPQHYAPRLSWLGVGNMGRAMAKRLAARGDCPTQGVGMPFLTSSMSAAADPSSSLPPLILWSRTFDHALDLHREEPARTVVADSLDTAVHYGDVIWSCMHDDESVLALFERILTGSGNAPATDIRGKLFVECTTVRPATANRVAREVTARGAEYVAMPVIGDPGVAMSGLLTVMPAGARRSVDRVRPYLAGILAQNVLDYGGREPGRGPLMKLVGNMAIINITESLAESHVLADKTGLPPETLEEFLETVLPGPHLLYSRRFNTGAYYKSASVVNIEMARRVAALVLELAGTTGTAIPAYEIASRLMDEVSREPNVGDDIGGMYGALRRASGLPWGNQRQT